MFFSACSNPCEPSPCSGSEIGEDNGSNPFADNDNNVFGFCTFAFDFPEVSTKRQAQPEHEIPYDVESKDVLFKSDSFRQASLLFQRAVISPALMESKWEGAERRAWGPFSVIPADDIYDNADYVERRAASGPYNWPGPPRPPDMPPQARPPSIDDFDQMKKISNWPWSPWGWAFASSAAPPPLGSAEAIQEEMSRFDGEMTPGGLSVFASPAVRPEAQGVLVNFLKQQPVDPDTLPIFTAPYIPFVTDEELEEPTPTKPPSLEYQLSLQYILYQDITSSLGTSNVADKPKPATDIFDSEFTTSTALAQLSVPSTLTADFLEALFVTQNPTPHMLLPLPPPPTPITQTLIPPPSSHSSHPTTSSSPPPSSSSSSSIPRKPIIVNPPLPIVEPPWPQAADASNNRSPSPTLGPASSTFSSTTTVRREKVSYFEKLRALTATVIAPPKSAKTCPTYKCKSC